MKINSIYYPIKLLKRTWFGDLAKLVRIAFTPINSLKTDCYTPTFRKPNLIETKAGIRRITTPRHIRELKKRLSKHDFRV